MESCVQRVCRFTDVSGVLGTVHLWVIGGRDHRGRAALRPGGVVGQVAWPHRGVSGLYAVRRHTIRLRGQGGVGWSATVLSGLCRRADSVCHAVRIHARVACLPVQRRPV